jgi:hypothetical protein
MVLHYKYIQFETQCKGDRETSLVALLVIDLYGESLVPSSEKLRGLQKRVLLWLVLFLQCVTGIACFKYKLLTTPSTHVASISKP